MIHLLSTINSNFVVPFRVMVHSLRRHRLSTTPITWHIFETDLSLEERAAIQAQLERSGIDLRWYHRDDERVAGWPLWGRAVPEMYQRVLAPDLLPEQVDKVIYLDADLLFLDAIEHLWCADISGSVIGAVQDAVIPYVSSPLGLSHFRALGFQRTDPYFNAGVLNIDLHAWRQHRVGEKAVDYVQRHRRSINLADQDVLNAVLHGQWRQLDDRWNIIGGAVGRAHFRARSIAAPRLETALREPAIIHFAGYLKPWRYLGLGSRWANTYVDTLFEVLPDYRFERSPMALTTAFYDRHLRTLLYPVERLAWRASRYLP